jgi:hypothetical protein
LLTTSQLTEADIILHDEQDDRYSLNLRSGSGKAKLETLNVPPTMLEAFGCAA